MDSARGLRRMDLIGSYPLLLPTKKDPAEATLIPSPSGGKDTASLTTVGESPRGIVRPRANQRQADDLFWRGHAQASTKPSRIA